MFCCVTLDAKTHSESLGIHPKLFKSLKIYLQYTYPPFSHPSLQAACTVRVEVPAV